MSVGDWLGVLVGWMGGVIAIIWGLQILANPSRVQKGTLAYRWMKLPNRSLTPQAVRLWAITWVIGGFLLIVIGIWVVLG